MSEPTIDGVSQALGRLEGKVDVVLTNQAAESKRITTLEDRTGSLERSRAWLLGAAAAVAAGCSALTHYFRN